MQPKPLRCIKLICIALLHFNYLWAQQSPEIKSINTKDDAWGFEENKGQLNPSTRLSLAESVSDNSIRYYGHQGGVYLYCKACRISFVFTKTEMESGAQNDR